VIIAVPLLPDLTSEWSTLVEGLDGLLVMAGEGEVRGSERGRWRNREASSRPTNPFTGKLQRPATRMNPKTCAGR